MSKNWVIYTPRPLCILFLCSRTVP